ncbi:MAG: hypothetical protein ACPK7O_05485 [Methanobacterium sp.]
MALLLTFTVAVSVFPLAENTNYQVASSNNAKIGLSEAIKHENVWSAKINGILSDQMLKVNALASLRTVKKVKKVKLKKTKVKKVKAASKVKVKVKYYYRGKWRTKWVYKYSAPKIQSTPIIQQNTVTNTKSENSETKSTVTADGKCSCSLYTDYNVHTGTYVNYCPYCGKYNTLTYTNQQGCPEGMFYCDMSKKGCDADFCIVHGKAHTNTNAKYLTPA